MLSRDMLQTEMEPITRSDSGLYALGILDEYKMEHLPVVEDGFLVGLVSELDLLDMSRPEESLAEQEVSMTQVSVNIAEHCFRTIELMGELSLTCLPVVDHENKYAGYITARHLVECLGEFTAARESGAILTLELSQNDYSLSEIARIVESNDARILSMYVSKDTDSTKMEVTLKIDRTDLAAIMQTFGRYKYHITATYYENDNSRQMQRRFELFMKLSEYVNMRIGIYGKEIESGHQRFAHELFDCLKSAGCELLAYDRFVEQNKKTWTAEDFDGSFADRFDMMQKKVDVLISLGGDGTLLDSTLLVVNSGVPIMGVNFGRLGFLANIAREDISKTIRLLTTRNFGNEARSVIQLDSQRNLFGSNNFALNEMTVSRKDTTAMISIYVYLKDQLLNSYWADGLIISTPTGSTGYSLSCGGPIIMPGSQNFVLTPIAPHNLTVRPFVLSDQAELRIRVEGRSKEYLVSLDSRVCSITSNDELIVRRAHFDIHLTRFEGQTFSETLRNKLMWGIDKRN